METSGRERRHRYYTVASYRKLVTKENLDPSTAGYADVDFTNVGGFLEVDPNLFYKDQNALHSYQDDFKDNAKAKNAKLRKYPPKNPILPDGTVKQGRPRKYPVGEDPKSLRKATKRKRDEGALEDGKTLETEQTQPAKKRRLKARAHSECVSMFTLHSNQQLAIAEVKKRGRPSKPKPENPETPAKKRGRPPKKKPELPPKPSSSGGMDQDIDVGLGKRGRSKPRDEIVYEDSIPKKRGRLDKEQSTHGDVETTCPPNEADIAVESPLSDPPSSTDSDVEPLGPVEPLPETERTSSGQVLHMTSQQQSSLALGLHPPPEATSPRIPMNKRRNDSLLATCSDSGMSASPPQRRELTEVVKVISRGPDNCTSCEEPQTDAHSVGPNSRLQTNTDGPRYRHCPDCR